MKLSKLKSLLGKARFIIMGLLGVLMLSNSVLPFASQSAENEISEYKDLSYRQNYVSPVTQIGPERKLIITVQRETHPYLALSSGTTSIVVAMSNYEDVVYKVVAYTELTKEVHRIPIS